MLEHKGIEFRRVNFPPGPAPRARAPDRLPGRPRAGGEVRRRPPRSGHARAAARARRAGAGAAARARRPAGARGGALGRRGAPAVGAPHGGLRRRGRPGRARRPRRGRPAGRAARPATTCQRAARRARGAGRRSARRRSSCGTTASAPARSSTGWTPGSREGVLNGEELRSPDFAVASSLALVEYIVALQPELQRRPLDGAASTACSAAATQHAVERELAAVLGLREHAQAEAARAGGSACAAPRRSASVGPAARPRAVGMLSSRSTRRRPIEHVGVHQARPLRAAHLNAQVVPEAAAHRACRRSGSRA